MKIEIDRVHLIDKFLRGELVGASLDAFKNKLRSDQLLADEVSSQRAIIEGIKLARREQLLLVLNGGKLANNDTELSPKAEPKVEPKPEPIQTSHTSAVVFEKIEVNDSQFISETLPDEPTTSTLEAFEYKTKHNLNNWYFAAAAILLAVFIYYYIFGYYIPHQQILQANKDSIIATADNNSAELTNAEAQQKPLVQNNRNDSTLKDSSFQRTDSLKNTDSLSTKNDKLMKETRYAILSFETLNSGVQDNALSSPNQNSEAANHSKLFKKTENSSIRVEKWHSASNFKGYKFKNNTLQVFDIPVDESLNLKYLDKGLFLKKNGIYYKINPTGQFEQFQKETKSELIKTLDSL